MSREVSLIGGFYKDNSLTFSAQDTVNWLPVPDESSGARSPIKLRGLPGLKPLTQSVIPLPQWTTWDDADRFGALASLENGNRTFFVGGSAEPPVNDSGFFNRVKGKDPKIAGKYYFEVYSDAEAGQDVDGSGSGVFNIRRTLRVGMTNKGRTLSLVESSSGTSPELAWEVAWKFVENTTTRQRGLYYRGGGQSNNGNFPAVNNPSSWIGVAVQIDGPAENCAMTAWTIIDGAWGESGSTPANDPAGHSALLISGINTVTAGGFVPYASIRYPRSLHPTQQLLLNAGQLPFRIGNAAFEAGGPLNGFTKGWPSE
ncbi:hypothetical protein [Pseudomonas sp.]|uniref:hypothetical protein n=1 Tax=Pseudomonas sp. TaxID=306 RepID=UPI00333EA83F